MKLHEPPRCVTKSVEFAAGVVDYVDAEDYENRTYPLLGGLSRDNRYAWISRGPKFEVVATRSGGKVAAWTFGGILKDTNTKVTCAVELPTVENGYGPSVSSLYAVGLDCYMSPGMVCLFDIRGSKVIKAIQVPGKVTSLALVDPGLIPEATTPLAPPLRLARGILAVGLSPGGQVLLLDLCLSEEDGAVSEGAPLSEEEYMCGTARPHLEHSDELNPSTVVVHAPGDPGTEGPVAPGEHLAIFLNEQSFVNNYFLLKLSESPSCMYRLPPSHVDITASLYVPQLASLLIGFSFGCFQVWDLGNLSLVHTSSLLAEPRNITFFAFQEPADDPRKYCYVWTVYGRKWDKGEKEGEAKKPGTSSEPSESESQEDLAFACMHDMYYHSKEWIDAYGWIYQNFVSIHRRFEIELSLGDSARSISRCISCFSLDGNRGRGRAPYLGRLETAEFDEVSSSENDLSLCCLVWQSWQVAEDGAPCNLQHNLTLFDLNQWYREQMPNTASPLVLFSSDLNGDPSSEGGSSHLGQPHLVTYALPFVTEMTMSANGLPLLFARINPASISRFCPTAVPIPEEHLFPSALAFECSFLLGSQCVINMATPGLQRSLLATLLHRGSKTYLYPSALFHECIAAGLKPSYVDIHNPSTTPVDEQRKFLLSLALEYNMLSYLIRCAVDTADGCASSLGVTLSFLMSWVKHRSCVLRECINKLSKPLFECGGTLLSDPQAARLMAVCGRQLKHLSTILKEILKRCTPWIFVDELKEIEQWCEVLGILALHSEVVQWFCHVGLLPELNEEDSPAAEIEASNIGVPRIPYPASILTAIYEERRKMLKSLPGVSDVADVLFIDGAVRECGERLTQETWRRVGSEASGSYPPPSLQALLRTYLLDGLPVEDKHCLVIYLFLDLAGLLDNARYASSISQLIKFPSAFSLSPSIIKLTQAFWLLDHKDFESAINMFLEPLICPQDIKLWQHRCVVRAFLTQGEPRKALKYVRVRQPPVGGLEDIKLNLTLLLENGLVHEAFNYQRKHRNDQNSEELLQHFFNGCGDLQELRWVLQNSLTPAEEQGLISFLTSQKDTKAHELHVMYYLQRSRIIEALRVNESERPSKKKELFRGLLDGRSSNMKTVRDAIVTGYASTMPPVTRQLATFCAKHSAIMNSWKEVPRPVPMSVVINKRSSPLSVRTKSTLIGTMMDKARETWNPPPLPPLLPPTPRPNIRTPLPPPSVPSSRAKRKREDYEGSDMPHLPPKNLFKSPARTSVDLIPFICTPVAPFQPRNRNVDAPSVVFPPQITCIGSKDDHRTPSKRPCISSNDGIPAASSLMDVADDLNKSALELLNTPVVPRKSKKATSVNGFHNDDVSTTGTEGSTPPREKPPRTPHSILKVRKAREVTADSPSFVDDKHEAEQDVGSLEEGEEEGPSVGRLIRFQLPTGLTPSPAQASPLRWPSFCNEEEDSATEITPKVSTARSPLSRSPIKTSEQQASQPEVQPSPRARASPRTPLRASPRLAIPTSPSRSPGMVEVRKEFSSSTKTTTRVKIMRESSVEKEATMVESTEHRRPVTRSSIHEHLEIPCKRKLEVDENGDDSGEFYSFEEPKREGSDEGSEVGRSQMANKSGTRILTDSFVKLFGSPYPEPKRRQSQLFKEESEEVDDEVEVDDEEVVEDDEEVVEDDEEVVEDEVEEVLEQPVEAVIATEALDLEKAEGEGDEEVEDIVDDEVEVKNAQVVYSSTAEVEVQPLNQTSQEDDAQKEVSVVGEVVQQADIVNLSPESKKVEVHVIVSDEEKGVDSDGPPPLVAISPSRKVQEVEEVVDQEEQREDEVHEIGSGGVAEVEQNEVLELGTSGIFSDDTEEDIVAKLSTVQEVSSRVEREEEESKPVSMTTEGQNILHGIDEEEELGEEPKAVVQLEAQEDEQEGKEGEEEADELNTSGKSLEILSSEGGGEESERSESEEEAEEDDEEEDEEEEEEEEEDEVVVISSTDEEEERSERESVGVETEKGEEDEDGADVKKEARDAKEYWEEYGYEEEMEEYEKNREDEEEEELQPEPGENEEGEKESWISQWERESGVNRTLWTDQEREEEEEIEEVPEDYNEGGEGDQEEHEGGSSRDVAGQEGAGVGVGQPTARNATKSLIKGWEEEYGLKEEDLGEQQELFDEEEEVDDEAEEEEEVEEEEDDEDEVEEDDDDEEEEEEDEEEEEEEEEEDDDDVVELVDEEQEKVVKAQVKVKEVDDSEEQAADEGVEECENIEEEEQKVVAGASEDVVELEKEVGDPAKDLKDRSIDGVESVAGEEPSKELLTPHLTEHGDKEDLIKGKDDIVEEENVVEGHEITEMESKMEIGNTMMEDDIVLMDEQKLDVFQRKTRREGKATASKESVNKEEANIQAFGNEMNFTVLSDVQPSGRELGQSSVSDVVEHDVVPIETSVDLPKVNEPTKEKEESKLVEEVLEVGSPEVAESTSIRLEISGESEDLQVIEEKDEKLNVDGSNQIEQVNIAQSEEPVAEAVEDMVNDQGTEVAKEGNEDDVVKSMDADVVELDDKQMEIPEKVSVAEELKVEETSVTEGEDRIPLIESEKPLKEDAKILDSSVEEISPKGEAVKGADAVTPTQVIDESADMEEDGQDVAEEKVERDAKESGEEKHEEGVNVSAKIEEYASSRRLTRHQMSLLSRSLGGTPTPATPESAKRKTKARTPPRSVRKDAPTTVSTHVDTPPSAPMPTTPLRSSARIRRLSTAAQGEEASGTQGVNQPPESSSKTATSTEAKESALEVVHESASEVVPESVSEGVPKSTAELEPKSASEVVPESVKESAEIPAVETTLPPSDEKSSPLSWNVSLEERIKKLKRGSPASGQTPRRTRRGSGKSVSSQGSASGSRQERSTPENKSGKESASEVVPESASGVVPEPVKESVEASAMETAQPPSDEKSSPQSWSASLEERIKKLKRVSPAPGQTPRRTRQSSGKSVASQESASGSHQGRSTSESKSTSLRQHSIEADSLPAGRRTRRMSTKSSSPHSSASTEIRMSPVPEGSVLPTEDPAEIAAVRAESPTPSVASTVESARSGPTRRRPTRARASVERSPVEAKEDPTASGIQRSGRVRRRVARQMEDSPATPQALSESGAPPVSEGVLPVEDPASAAQDGQTRAESPTPSVASTVDSVRSGPVRRRSTGYKARQSVEREDPPLTPTHETLRSGRVRRRSLRLMENSPVTARALSPERSSPPSESGSEVSGYSGSVASTRSHASAMHEEREEEGEELVLRSGRKRAKHPVAATKSGPRKERMSRSARFLKMPEENEEDEEAVASMDTAFLFSPPKPVHSDPSSIEPLKESAEFTLSPPKIVAPPPVVATGRRRSMAARSSIASLGAIPEDGEILPPEKPSEAKLEQSIEDVLPATPPRRRGRHSLPGAKVSEKLVQAMWSSPRRARGKSKEEAAQAAEESGSKDAEVGLATKRRARYSSAGSLQTIKELHDEEDSSGPQAQKKMHPVLRNKRSSPARSVVSEGALDRDDDADLEEKDSNRAKDDSDTLPRKRKSSSRKRKVIVPYKPRKSAKL